MSQESQALREAIRTGTVQCPCRSQVAQGHLQGCQWIVAVLWIYELEREEEKDPD